MSAPLILRHSSSLDHLTGAHPECPERIVAIDAALASAADLDCEVRESPAATDEQLLAVHGGRHVDRIREICESGGGAIDPDTLVSPRSFEAAVHAAGGSVAAVEAVLTGEADSAFAIHRPPGHHAESERAMGFCLFANAAVAVRHAISAGLAKRVAIIDWDVHHGNGTEAIFAEDPDVLFASIHQSPLWPGSGDPGFRGIGAGRGTTLNLPVPAGSGDADWLSLIEHVIAPLVERHEPDLIVVSAGYDAHADDPLAGCLVSDRGFELLARSVARLGRRAGAPVAAVLEGGYDRRALAAGVLGTLRGLASPGDGVELPVSEVSRAALARLERDG